MKLCSIEGCDKKYLAKGYCVMHYKRNRKYGEPNITLKTPYGEPLEYFYHFIKIETDDCIEWPYGKRNGYGRIIYKGKNTFVHRLALMLTLGEPPEDKPLALHAPGACHNRSCFNPRHLYWGNQKDNRADTIIDGTEVRGEKHGKAKLTENQVLEIRADNRTQRIIAEQYSVSRTTVSDIKTRKRWSWL